jgi:hypothetical protein
MLVPDLMHEFELGVWKAILRHLMRILYAAGNDCIQEFNKRYVKDNSYCCIATYSHSRFRMVPTFGSSTIRRFGKNVSHMKKLAARDFEDILQVHNRF